MSQFNKFFQILRNARLVTVLCSSLLVSCGDLTTAGIGGTGITSGEITGFGSVFVNGVEFNTDNSQFEVDGDTSAIVGDLKVGMVVIINGSTDDNGLTGTADSIVYDDQIQGPLEAIPTEVAGSGGNQKLFTIFNQEIIIDQASTSFIGTSFETLTINDLVEVSGFFAPDSSIHATFVGKNGVLKPEFTQVELKGTISTFTPTTLTLSGAFSGITINIDPFSTIIDVPGGLANGLFVEVDGIYQGPSSIDATEIEIEDNDFGESVDQISLQGIVSQSNGIGNFTIGNQLVDASGATISPIGAAIEVGVNVEVEGSIIGGTLIANEVELREGPIELKAFISAIPPGTGEFTLEYFYGSITVSTDNQTRFEDDGGPDITLIDLELGDYVVVKAIDNSGLVIATNVRRRAPEDTEIQGSVESQTSSSITILGIEHFVDPLTSYEIFSIPTDETTFFAGLSNGDIVEIRDNAFPDSPDGIAEEVSR